MCAPNRHSECSGAAHGVMPPCLERERNPRRWRLIWCDVTIAGVSFLPVMVSGEVVAVPPKVRGDKIVQPPSPCSTRDLIHEAQCQN